jgi:hypothetical protein
MNLHAISYLVTDLVAMLLQRAGMATIYCSAFKKGGHTVVIFAPSNSGKTLATMTACLKHDGQFIAEDFAITDGKTLHSVPATSTFRRYGQIDKRLTTRAVNMANRFLPFLELFPLTKSKQVIDILPRDSLCQRSDATHLILLDRGPRSARQLERAEALWRVRNLNRGAVNYERSLLNNAYEFFNPEFDVERAATTEKKILKSLVENVKDCILVSTNEPLEYSKMILEAIGAS